MQWSRKLLEVERRVWKKGKKKRKRPLGVVTPLVAVEEPVAVDAEVLPLAEEEVVEEEVVEEEVVVGPEAPLKEGQETLEAQMIQIRIQSQT